MLAPPGFCLFRARGHQDAQSGLVGTTVTKDYSYCNSSSRLSATRLQRPIISRPSSSPATVWTRESKRPLTVFMKSVNRSGAAGAHCHLRHWPPSSRRYRPHYGAQERGKPTRPGSDTAVIVGRRARASVARQHVREVFRITTQVMWTQVRPPSLLSLRPAYPPSAMGPGGGAALTLAEVLDVSARCNADSAQVTDLCRSISRPND
jgi:hypothetical protein